MATWTKTESGDIVNLDNASTIIAVKIDNKWKARVFFITEENDSMTLFTADEQKEVEDYISNLYATLKQA
jgi:hypothetical protein